MHVSLSSSFPLSLSLSLSLCVGVCVCVLALTWRSSFVEPPAMEDAPEAAACRLVPDPDWALRAFWRKLGMLVLFRMPRPGEAFGSASFA